MTDAKSLFFEAEQMRSHKPTAAAARLQRAADRGDREAKFQLAIVLSDSQPDVAIHLLTVLDRENFDGAAYQLGSIYWHTNSDLAETWFRRAVAREDFATAAAAMSLGMLIYRQGSESTGNGSEAIALLSQALAGGIQQAKFWLARAIEASDPRRSLELYAEAGEDGEARAYRHAAWLLLRQGHRDAARELFRTGAELGDLAAMPCLFHLDKRRHTLRALVWLLRYYRAGGITKTARKNFWQVAIRRKQGMSLWEKWPD